MTAECFLAIVILCGIFTVCEIIGKFTDYKIPTLVLVMVIFVIFGGQLGILPSDLLDRTGFSSMVYSFGLPFVLAGFGTSMSLKSLKEEGRTVVISLISIVCIVGLGLILGFIFMDMRTSIYGAVEVAGGGQAGLIFLTHLQEQEGTEKAVALILCLMNVQILFGYPFCSLAMRKSMKLRIKNGNIPTPVLNRTNEDEEVKTLIKVPDYLKDNFYYVFLMLGIICFCSAKLYALTSLSAYLWYILLGFLFAELGLLEHNCLAKAGLAPLMFGAMFAVVIADFLSLNLADIGTVAMNFFILIACGIVGCVVSGLLSSKIFKIDIFEGFAISIGCMVGYPPSQKVTEETLQAVRAECDITDEQAEGLRSYYEPKIIISGIVTISLVTGILAGIIVSFL